MIDRPEVLEVHDGPGTTPAELRALCPEEAPAPVLAVDIDTDKVKQPENLPSHIVEVRDEKVTAGCDRSKMSHALLAKCVEADLSNEEALAVARKHAPSVAKWGTGHRLTREVARSLGKLRKDAEMFANLTDKSKAGKAGTSEKAEPRKPGPTSVATLLVRLATERYRFAQDDTGRAFAVMLNGPALAVPLEGGHGALREKLARLYYEEHGKAAAKSALADAITTLAGMAATAPPETLPLRSVVLDDGARVVVDLGRPDGHAVEVTADGWRKLERSPVPFRRTELTGELPDPEPGDGASALRRLVNVAGDLLPLLLGWLVSTFLVDMPRPILLLLAEQGAGKTSTARALVAMVDPSPVPLRAAPSNLEAWIVAAAGSSVVALDNLSTIPEWLSDALCRAATGEGLVRRKLYTDDGLAVTTMRRAVVLTTIDPGALRGDLAERIVALELEPIEPGDRVTDAQLAAEMERDLPAILAATFDALAEVLAHRPQLPADLELPRMADFGRILAALDLAAGTDTLGTYVESLDRVAYDVVDGDPLASALRIVAEEGGFEGTATELLKRIAPMRPKGKGYWPETPRAVSAGVSRATQALRAVGVEVATWRTAGQRVLSLALSDDAMTEKQGSPLLNLEVREEKRDPQSPEPHVPQGSELSFATEPSHDGTRLCATCGAKPAPPTSSRCIDCTESAA